MPQRTFALKARWVIPVCGPPLDSGIVVVRDGLILHVGPDSQGAPVEDLGDVALLPGFVNAHTHLEFSDLEQPLGAPGMPLPDWIGEVLSHRRAGGRGPAAIAAGLNECIGSGTTMVGEIATSDWRTSEIPPWRPGVVMFHEAIGPTLARAHSAAEAAEVFLQAAPRDGILAALSPHAPYTVHTRLLESLIALSQKYRVPLAMHLAETREELELLNLGAGPFRDMLESVGAWDEGEDARLSCVLDYLTALSRAERALVVHGNYLDDDEVAFLADHNDRMAVVYCPRTHAYFEHEPYPLSEMLAAGVAMAIGTDSRASNPDLSMLSEIRSIAESHPDVPLPKIVELATLGGAGALGLADQIGTLEAGKRADFVAVRNGVQTGDPVEALFGDESLVADTWIAGERC